jgi:isoquinoline 1-oxidoreductase subunit alpha
MGYTFRVNGAQVSANVPGDMPLLWYLRDVLGITGPKYGCGVGVCGACTSHMRNSATGTPTAIRPCTTTVSQCSGKWITTIEGLASGSNLHKVQQAWLDKDVAQCGFCQPGQIMRACALLASTPKPSDAQIDAAMSDNVCRCGTYMRIREAIKLAASR